MLFDECMKVISELIVSYRGRGGKSFLLVLQQRHFRMILPDPKALPYTKISDISQHDICIGLTSKKWQEIEAIVRNLILTGKVGT